MKNCIINVACREPYTNYQVRLLDSIQGRPVDVISWTDKFPVESRTHHESLYGFKVYAFKHAFKKGYTNVLWLDSPCYLLVDPTEIFEQIEKDGHYLISTEDSLHKYVNSRTLRRFGMTREGVQRGEYKLLSGSFIGLNQNSPLLLNFEWYEKNNFFLNAWEDAQQPKEDGGFISHRHDEAIYSMLAYTGKYKVVRVYDSHFQNNNAIVKSEKW